MAHKVNITLSISGDIYKQMKKHPEIKWSEAARKGIMEQLARVGGIIEGKEMLKMLPEDTRKGIDEISKYPDESWRKHYKKIKESGKKRAKLSIRASS